MPPLVAVRPPRSVSPPLSATLFDVVLASSSSPHRFVHVQRRLCDFAQLQHELARELELPSLAPFKSDVATAAAEVLALQSAGGNDDSDADAALLQQLMRVRGATDDTTRCAMTRLAWQLERVLTSLLTHTSRRVRTARTLQRFVRGKDSEPPSATDTRLAEPVTRDWIPAGCVTEHTVRVDAHTGAQLVRWRFVSEGDGVVFSARFKAGSADGSDQDDETTTGERGDADTLDPYASLPDAGADEATATDELAFFQPTRTDGMMAQYPTRFAFPAAGQRETDSGLDRPDATRTWVTGCFVAHTSGELVLEWENADTSSVLTKTLAHNVVVVPLHDAAVGDSSSEATDALSDAKAEGEPAWLLSLFQSSELVNMDDVIRDHDENDSDVELEDQDVGGPRDRSGSDGRATTQTVRLQEEAALHVHRMHELEERLTQLQDELRVRTSELKRTEDELAISGEIYRASLETITQLEIDAKHSSRSTSAVSEPPAPLSFASESTNAATVSAKEHQRVVDLCTAFQEQCLWRSIELTESEKQSLVLAAQLRDTVDTVASLHAQLAARDDAISRLEADVKKLRAHKTILVHEVKKLQPYAHVNLAALVQDAQEARMMQRSLQARLDTLHGTPATSDLTAGTGSTVVSSPTSTGDEDGAGGGFVVIEAADHHGSFRDGGASEL